LNRLVGAIVVAPAVRHCLAVLVGLDRSVQRWFMDVEVSLAKHSSDWKNKLESNYF